MDRLLRNLLFRFPPYVCPTMETFRCRFPSREPTAALEARQICLRMISRIEASEVTKPRRRPSVFHFSSLCG